MRARRPAPAPPPDGLDHARPFVLALVWAAILGGLFAAWRYG